LQNTPHRALISTRSLDLGNSLSVGGGIGSFQKGNLRTQSQGLHYRTRLPTAARSGKPTNVGIRRKRTWSNKEGFGVDPPVCREELKGDDPPPSLHGHFPLQHYKETPVVASEQNLEASKNGSCRDAQRLSSVVRLPLLTKELRWPSAPQEVPILKRTSAEMSRDA
jgi:hypothetical protein